MKIDLLDTAPLTALTLFASFLAMAFGSMSETYWLMMAGGIGFLICFVFLFVLSIMLILKKF